MYYYRHNMWIKIKQRHKLAVGLFTMDLIHLDLRVIETSRKTMHIRPPIKV